MQAGGKKLRAEHTEVVFNLQHLGFGVEVVNPGDLDATGGDAESIVLDDLKLVTERCAGDREPYRSCVCAQGAYEGLECGQQGLLMLSPAVIQ